MELTSKERIILAIKNQKPDRVPVMPDFSNMIPCRLTGKPFWDIYLDHNPTLFYAYANAVDYFGIDGWFQTYDAIAFKRQTTVGRTSQVVDIPRDRKLETVVYHTSKGDLTEATTYYRSDPPTKTEKIVKDIIADFPKVRELYSPIVGYDASRVEEHRARVGDKGIFTLGIGFPGVQLWHDCFTDSTIGAVYAIYDYPEIMDEWAALLERDCVKMAEIMLDQKPDVLMLGGSGTLTLATPELVQRYAMPTITKVTKMAKEAGIPTMLHSCGITMPFAKMLVEQSDLNCLNPLEPPPMGDVDLKEFKQLYGNKLAMMGNLHTTDIMLNGSPKDVEMAAKKAIDDAGEGGGFILSTGDQCGLNTPDENIFKLVEVASTYGVYN